MNQSFGFTLKRIILITVAGWWVWGVAQNVVPMNTRSKYGIDVQSAWASEKYGILGRTAPKLYLDDWIDGEGNAIAPIDLPRFKGKVIYLYFFQDW